MPAYGSLQRLAPDGTSECVMLCPVLLLSRVTGQEVTTPDGRAIGRLADLTVRLDDPGPQLVEHLVVKRRNGSLLLLPWHAVAAMYDRRVVLATDDVDAFAVGSLVTAVGPDEILLRRDVLDTQVVDVIGQRLARVADVLLARTGGAGLEVMGVEVGFGGVVRRLGLGALVRSGGDVVAWRDLHLTSDRGHAAQLSTPRAAVHRLDARGLAALVSRVDTDAAAEILAANDPTLVADAVRTAHPSVAERLLRALPPSSAARILNAMPVDLARRWRDRLARRQGRRHFLRSRVWPRRRHLFRGRTS
jgi:sporulation protein YlmC with PRC-barrel domain